MLIGVFGLALGLLILVGPWLYTAVVERRRREDAERQRQWGSMLESRLSGLERAVRRLFDDLAALQGARVPPSQAEAPPPAPVPTAAPAKAEDVTPVAAKAVEPPAIPIAAAPPTAEPAAAATSRLILPSESRPPAHPVAAPAPNALSEPVEIPAPSFAGVEPEPPAHRGFEETLGANWLNKLGVVILVLGVAFFLAYQLTNLGPAGKVTVGFLVAGAMLGGGIWLERKERYRIPARALIGGGWALLYFVAYAMYYIDAAKVLASQPADLLLMLAVAALMVWHTLRYDSQAVTGIAFLLGFTTITIHHTVALSLAAGAILALGLIAIVLWRRWYELEVFGILAAYLNHFLWLQPIVERLQPGHRYFAEYPLSTGLLVMYWAAFRTSYLARKTDGKAEENVSTVAALLNGGLFLGLMKYQAVHPEWAFWFLMVLGGIELGLGQLPLARRRRMPFVLLTIIGTSLAVAAIPFRYSGNSQALLWLVEGEALFLAGVWAREIVFRRLGMGVAGLATGYLLFFRVPGAFESGDWRVGVTLAVAALAFYLDNLWIGRRNADLFRGTADAVALRAVSYCGALALLAAAAVSVPEAWVAAAWMALALLLAVLARTLDNDDLALQAVGLTVAGVLRTLAVNLRLETSWHGISLRLATVGMAIAALYIMAQVLRPKKLGETISLSPGFTWAGSFLLGLLCWYELQPVAVAIAWALLGLLLLEVGLGVHSRHLRWQAYVSLAAAFIRIFFANLNAAGAPGEISPRLYTTLPLALVFFYAYVRINSADEAEEAGEGFAGIVAACCGTATIVAVSYFELPGNWVATAWSAMAAALIALAWRSGRRVFLHQGVALSLPVVWRGVTFTLMRSPSLVGGEGERWLTVGSAVAGLLAAVGMGFLVRRREEEAPNGAALLFDYRPEQTLFFAMAVLLTALLGFMMRSGMITVSWGLEGVCVFLFALWVGERSFRLTGLALLLLCVGKIGLIDFWQLTLRDKWVTLVILGAALMLVSFLYSKYRETIRQYL